MQDLISVKLRAGYVLIFEGCPLMWVSKIPTQIVVSNTETKCITLSQSILDLLLTPQLLQEVIQHLGLTSGEIATH